MKRLSFLLIIATLLTPHITQANHYSFDDCNSLSNKAYRWNMYIALISISKDLTKVSDFNESTYNNCVVNKTSSIKNLIQDQITTNPFTTYICQALTQGMNDSMTVQELKALWRNTASKLIEDLDKKPIPKGLNKKDQSKQLDEEGIFKWANRFKKIHLTKSDLDPSHVAFIEHASTFKNQLEQWKNNVLEDLQELKPAKYLIKKKLSKNQSRLIEDYHPKGAYPHVVNKEIRIEILNKLQDTTNLEDAINIIQNILEQQFKKHSAHNGSSFNSPLFNYFYVENRKSLTHLGLKLNDWLELGILYEKPSEIYAALKLPIQRWMESTEHSTLLFVAKSTTSPKKIILNRDTLISHLESLSNKEYTSFAAIFFSFLKNKELKTEISLYELNNLWIASFEYALVEKDIKAFIETSHHTAFNSYRSYSAQQKEVEKWVYFRNNILLILPTQNEIRKAIRHAQISPNKSL